MITTESFKRIFEKEKEKVKIKKILLDFINWREHEIHPMDASNIIDKYLSKNKKNDN